MSEERLPIRIRPMVEGDVSFVMSSWLKSYRDTPETWGSSNTEYYTSQKRIIAALLRCSHVAVACDPEDPDQVYGWCCWSPRDKDVVVHYAYVKRLFQRMGVGRELLKLANPHALPVYTTHLGPAARELRNTVQYRFKPFLLAALLVGGLKQVDEGRTVKETSHEKEADRHGAKDDSPDL